MRSAQRKFWVWSAGGVPSLVTDVNALAAVENFARLKRVGFGARIYVVDAESVHISRVGIAPS